MKQKLFALLLSLMLLFALTLNVSAAAEETAASMVMDFAGLLTGDEQSKLEENVRHLRQAYEMDFVILTVDSLDGKSAQDYADDYYDDNGYADDGVLFLLAMEEREWYISTCGAAIYALTDYGIQQLGERAVPYLSEGDYYGGFAAYLDSLPFYIGAYEAGAPVDGHADTSGDYYHGDREAVVYYDSHSSNHIRNPFPVSIAIGLITALVTILIMRGSMNTKRPQRSAGEYMRRGSYRLRTHQDMFLYSRISKVRRQQNNGGSGGGGSSVHRSSGGRSHGGGGGRF